MSQTRYGPIPTGVSQKENAGFMQKHAGGLSSCTLEGSKVPSPDEFIQKSSNKTFRRFGDFYI
jgi:hypothetical protein